MGYWGSQKTLAWGFAMAPHRLCALVLIVFLLLCGCNKCCVLFLVVSWFGLCFVIVSFLGHSQGRIQDFWKGGSYVQRCRGFALLIFSHFLAHLSRRLK